MASIRVKFRPSQKQESEGTLYYQIIHNRMVRQVKTDFKIFITEWNNESDGLILKAGEDRFNYLKSVQYRVNCGKQRFGKVYMRIAGDLKDESVSIDTLVCAFEKELTGITLFNYMESQICKLQQNGQVRTAETYQTTLNSFKRFRGDCDLPLNELTAEIVESYQYYLKHSNVSLNTISFYMRRLRACYNRAVDDEIVPAYRLFKYAYTGMDKTMKRAINVDALKVLKKLDLSKCPAQDYSRDIFFLSFYLRGMSFIDMAYLQKSNLKDDILTYKRRKTGQKLSIEWESCMQKIVAKYNSDNSPYLINIIKEEDGDQRKQYQKALANVNRNLKRLGKAANIKIPLTMYVARHTWASTARHMNIPISVISEGLGHDNEVTTSIYLSTVGSEAIDNANKKIIKLI